MSEPFVFVWDGDAMVPVSRHMAKRCDADFVVGQRYPLAEVHSRSHASHAHYFAVLREIWNSLPDFEMDQYPTVEKMRKTALIRTGYRTETQYICDTADEAKKLATDLKQYDDYQIVIVRENVVVVYRAKSQDTRSMDKAEFQASKDAVLDWCGNLIGVDAKTLSEVRESA